MKKITDVLEKNDFAVSVEVVPPRNGTDPSEFFSRIESLKGKADFVSVTKGAGGSLRGGTLPISYMIKNEYGIETVAHFVCRERTDAEIENDLMDMHYFKISNILALRGDAPAGDKDEPWDGDYEYAYKLVEHICKLNSGKYLPRKGFDSSWRDGVKTDFCILVAGHPENPTNDEITHMKAKVSAGAEVIITQMVFSFEEYRKYVESLRKAGINLPVIAGIRPLTTRKQAASVEEFFGLKVSDRLKKGISSGSEHDARKFGLDYSADMVRKLKEYGAPGVHFFVLNETGLVDEIMKRV